MCHLKLSERMCKVVVSKVVHSEDVVRKAAARALAAAVKQNRKQITMVLQELLELYQDKLYVSLHREDVALIIFFSSDFCHGQHFLTPSDLSVAFIEAHTNHCINETLQKDLEMCKLL